LGGDVRFRSGSLARGLDEINLRLIHIRLLRVPSAHQISTINTMAPKLGLRLLAVLSIVLGVSAWSAAPQAAFSLGVTRTARSSSTRLLAAGPATLDPPVKEKTEEIVKDEEKVSESYTKKGGWAVRLFNDIMNKREFVAMCLTKVCGLSDGQAYQVMMQAHQNGVSIVGRYDFERAELYRDSLVEHGLVCDMIPVEED